MKKIKRIGIFLFLGLSVSGILLAQTSSEMSVKQVGTYDQLLAAVRATRAEARVRVEKAVEQERVREAWEIGRLIDAHVLQHKERADYGEKVLARLSNDLGMSRTELSYMLQFARAYPIFRPAEKLTWSHYEALLSVNDPRERDALAEKAVKEKWTRDQMREAIKVVTKKEKPAATTGAETLQPLTLGQPGTYKIILAKAGPFKGELALDLGFSVYYRFSEVTKDLTGFKEGELVAFEDNEMQLLGKPSVGKIEDRLYTYNARVTRVLDGDTIEAVIDLGFGIATTQVLRLRGIDCPELVTKDGKEAKAFVEKILQMPGDGDREAKTKAKGSVIARSDEGATRQSVLIKTLKSDKYDRYLVDIFYVDPTGEAQYLNNVLLQKGLAVRVRS